MSADLKKLITKSILGHESAQRTLYEAYRSKWYMLCLRYGSNRHEADDIFQEGLIQIFRDLHQFDDTRSSFATWSSRILAHGALRYLKQHSWHQMMQEIDQYGVVDEGKSSVYDQIAAKELTEMIQQLPCGYRVVFNMNVLEGYTHKEIAKVLGITEGTSKSQLSKAKKMLRKKLEFHFSEYSKT